MNTNPSYLALILMPFTIAGATRDGALSKETT
jgi:hypothetical protein